MAVGLMTDLPLISFFFSYKTSDQSITITSRWIPCLRVIAPSEVKQVKVLLLRMLSSLSVPSKM